MKAHIRAGISEEEVVRYLQSHPDFFQRNTLLLGGLTIPHPESGQAISLMERQVGLLREQKQELQRKLRQIAQAAAANEHLLTRIELLLLALLDAPDQETLLGKLEQALWDEFDVNAVTLWLIADNPGQPHEIAPTAPGLKPFVRVIGQREPICGYLSNEQRQVLFDAETAEAVRSAVVIPLTTPDDNVCLGLLAIGSEDAKRFHPEMGTVYIRHLGVLLAGILRRRS